MILATYFPLPVLTLLGDVPPESSVLAALPLWAQMLLPVVAYAIFSGLVGGLNEVLRKRDAEGVPVSPRLRLVAAVLNAMAANLDKSRQQAAKSKEPAP